MTIKRNLIVAAGLAALLLPMAASADSWGGYGGQWMSQDNAWRDRDDGDRQAGDYYDDGRAWFHGFPEFAGIRSHLKQEIREGLEDGWLSQERAQRMVARYRDIERDEYREFREHGWNLPDRERAEFRDRLSALDHRLDMARDGRF